MSILHRIASGETEIDLQNEQKSKKSKNKIRSLVL